MKTLSMVFLAGLLLGCLIIACGDDDDTKSSLNAPEALIALPSATSQAASVDLYWLADADAVSYSVYRKIGDGPFLLVLDTAVTTAKLVNRSLATSPTAPGPPGVGGTQCQDVRIVIDPASHLLNSYYVRYKTSDGRTSPASRTVSLVPSELAEPYEITITQPINGAEGVTAWPDFAWDFVDTTMTYVVTLKNNDETTWLYSCDFSSCQLADTSGSVYVPCDSTGLASQTLYYWEVWAIGDGFCGMAVGEAAFTTE